jgi:hypothetical protein
LRQAWWLSAKEAWSFPAGGGSIPRPISTLVVAFKESRPLGAYFLKKGRLGLKAMTKVPFGKVKHFRFWLESLGAVPNRKKSKRFRGESV